MPSVWDGEATRRDRRLQPGEVWRTDIFQWGGAIEFALTTTVDPGDPNPLDDTGTFQVDVIACG